MRDVDLGIDNERCGGMAEKEGCNSLPKYERCILLWLFILLDCDRTLQIKHTTPCQNLKYQNTPARNTTVNSI